MGQWLNPDILLIPLILLDLCMDKEPGLSAAQSWWTPAREHALRLTLDGERQAQIAKKTQMHRHTIAAWQSAPTWMERLQSELRERTVSASLRRAHMTEMIASRLEKLVEAGLKRDDLRVGEMQLLLRELREYSRLERENFEGHGTPHGTSRRKYFSEKHHPSPTWGSSAVPSRDQSPARDAFRLFLSSGSGPLPAK
jgi:hypothetical protein